MDSTEPAAEIAIDLSPTIKVYKDGKVERLKGNDIVPASFDPKTKVHSKDVVYSPENNLYARLYIPNQRQNQNQNQKLPLLVYFHGGGFCIETAFYPTYHNYLNTLVSEANVIAVSVDYRRAPENPVPCAHDDSWTALKWVASHVNGEGPEDWLNCFADFQRVFFSGDSAGANIAHHMGMRHGREILGVNFIGIVLIHPYFLGREAVGNETADSKKRDWVARLWRLTCPSSTSGCDDPWINPAIAGSDLASLGCARMLVFVAENDFLRSRGWFYYDKLKESGWRGNVEIVGSKGEQHVFHLINPICENAVAMLERTASFLNHQEKT
ncbi:probable carboxylesterase 12 [Citrus clementina]|uniref:probable carboxylesterase 12 n=1 Tax=Citrus clementina TaxID=85681 RepID=UPI000CED0A1E|nr:probable carboxylesterase 12 [Citrus x clementina]